MKTTAQVYREYRINFDRIRTLYETEMDEARKQEFPIGCEVEWDHGAKKIRGVVVSFCDNFGKDEVRVRVKSNPKAQPVARKCVDLRRV